MRATLAPMQWMTPREQTSPWLSKSVDGVYLVGQAVMGSYGAYRVERATGNPVQIGNGGSMTEAQELCEQHRQRNQPRPN